MSRSFSLSEEFFLLAHDDTNGKPLISTDVLGLGIAAGLLAQLLPEQRIAITRGGGVLLRRFEATGRAATDQVVRMMHSTHASRPDILYPVTDWLRYLRDLAYAEVSGALVRDEVVQERSGLRGKRYLAANVLDATSPRTGLVYLCRHPPADFERCHEQQFTLAGLAIATNMERALYAITGADLGDQLRAFTHQLPGDTRMLLDALEQAVQARVRTPRGR
ncbi:MAG TPA: GPP34 family phosphoprotein [Rugosimonospora sp.]|nr:GPP34 family phosphoprotein [Rugosimonospora sp.]